MPNTKNNSQTSDRWAAVSLVLLIMGAAVFVAGSYIGAVISGSAGCNIMGLSILAGATCFGAGMVCDQIADKYNNNLNNRTMKKGIEIPELSGYIYDYREAVKYDVLSYIEDNNIRVTADNREEVAEQLSDELWDNDHVTGNGSGSYTYSTYKAACCLVNNNDLIAEAIEEFGGLADFVAGKDAYDAYQPERLDVMIRCYLLAEAIAAALDDVETAEEATE